MRITAANKKVLTEYCNRIMVALDEIDGVVADMQRSSMDIFISDGYAQIVDEVIRLRKLYKIDVMKEDKRGRKRKEEVNAKPL
jgi:hypothetical protein